MLSADCGPKVKILHMEQEKANHLPLDHFKVSHGCLRHEEVMGAGDASLSLLFSCVLVLRGLLLGSRTPKPLRKTLEGVEAKQTSTH